VLDSPLEAPRFGKSRYAFALNSSILNFRHSPYTYPSNKQQPVPRASSDIALASGCNIVVTDLKESARTQISTIVGGTCFRRV
jgi:hypothetical protein